MSPSFNSIVQSDLPFAAAAATAADEAAAAAAAEAGDITATLRRTLDQHPANATLAG
jgi:hypothetical protein